jgi:hypothetical protein
LIIFIQKPNRKYLVSTYIYAFGDLLFDWPKSRQKARANLNSLSDSSKGDIELLERKFAESYMADYFSFINITNRKDFLTVKEAKSVCQF